MNEFYSINPLNTKPTDKYQLENLGVERETISGVGRQRHNGYDSEPPRRWSVTEKVKSEDYDGVFANKICRVNPPYDLEKLIDYHLDYYTKKGGSRDKFIKHIQYVVLPYIEKWYKDSNAHIELTREWIESSKKIELSMIEYSDLNNIEKTAINTLIASTDQQLLSSQYIWINKMEIDALFTDNIEHYSKRLIDFFLANDFIKLRAYDGTYFIEQEGRKMFKCGSIEKYYEKQQAQYNQTNPNIIGHGNVVNIANGNIHQSNINITVNQEQYKELKDLGIEDDKIEELKKLIEDNKKDKPTFIKSLTKWSGDVLKQVATKGLIDNIPHINAFVTHLLSTI